jgi:hypothetical protein
MIKVFQVFGNESIGGPYYIKPPGAYYGSRVNLLHADGSWSHTADIRTLKTVDQMRDLKIDKILE